MAAVAPNCVNNAVAGSNHVPGMPMQMRCGAEGQKATTNAIQVLTNHESFLSGRPLCLLRGVVHMRDPGAPSKPATTANPKPFKMAVVNRVNPSLRTNLEGTS